MNNSLPVFEVPENEPALDYEPDSTQRKELKQRIVELKKQSIEIPLIIGGKEVRTGVLGECIAPHEHRHVLAEYHKAGREEAGLAIGAALDARKVWSGFEWADRIAIFKKATDLLSTKWRSTMNAATMLGQSKSAHQAEIDSACELADFLRFNSYFAKRV